MYICGNDGDGYMKPLLALYTWIVVYCSRETGITTLTWSSPPFTPTRSLRNEMPHNICWNTNKSSSWEELNQNVRSIIYILNMDRHLGKSITLQWPLHITQYTYSVQMKIVSHNFFVLDDGMNNKITRNRSKDSTVTWRCRPRKVEEYWCQRLNRGKYVYSTSQSSA